MRINQFKALLFSIIVLGAPNTQADTTSGESSARSVCDSKEICRHFNDLKEKGSTMFKGSEWVIDENPSMFAKEGKNMLITHEKLRSMEECPRVEQGGLIFIGKSNVCGVKFSGKGYDEEKLIIVLSKKGK